MIGFLGGMGGAKGAREHVPEEVHPPLYLALPRSTSLHLAISRSIWLYLGYISLYLGAEAHGHVLDDVARALVRVRVRVRVGLGSGSGLGLG